MTKAEFILEKVAGTFTAVEQAERIAKNDKVRQIMDKLVTPITPAPNDAIPTIVTNVEKSLFPGKSVTNIHSFATEQPVNVSMHRRKL